MTSRFREHLSRTNLIPDASRLLVGVSGGVDSVLLTVLLDELGHNVHLAHVNYGLRGTDSDADETFVRNLASQLDVPLHVYDARSEMSGSTALQARARAIRYTWFERTALSEDITLVAVAQHDDDQLETILMNLGRGATPAGLAGMPIERSLCRASSITLVRPFLGFSRREIENEAQKRCLAFREDESNKSDRFERSAIRNELRMLSQVDYEAFREQAIALSRSVRSIKTRILMAITNTETDLKLCEMEALPPFLVNWIIMEMIEHLDPNVPRRTSIAQSVANLARSQPGRSVSIRSVRALRERDRISLSVRVPLLAHGRDRDSGCLQIEPDGVTWCDAGELSCESLDTADVVLADCPQSSAYLDKALLEERLHIRRWDSGDRFFPLGAQGRKKVKSFLTDAKVPVSTKKEVQVLTCGGDIVWVVGHRIDHRYRVSETTTDILHCSWRSRGAKEVQKTKS